jgi:hypothetical protein
MSRVEETSFTWVVGMQQEIRTIRTADRKPGKERKVQG